MDSVENWQLNLLIKIRVKRFNEMAAMKLSELIARLAEMLEEHGDVDVCIFASEYGEEAVSAVSLSSSDGQKRIVIE